MLEFSLHVIPLFGLLFVLADVSWAVFARSTLQHAVREGVRYAVTSQTLEDTGHIDSIKAVVQRNAMGLLAGATGAEKIHVRFYDPTTFTDITNSTTPNIGGNLVEVSVEGYNVHPLVPVSQDALPMHFTARASDRMEASPATGPPAL